MFASLIQDVALNHNQKYYRFFFINKLQIALSITKVETFFNFIPAYNANLFDLEKDYLP